MLPSQGRITGELPESACQSLGLQGDVATTECTSRAMSSTLSCRAPAKSLGRSFRIPRMLALRKLLLAQASQLKGGKDPEVPERSRMSGVCPRFEASGERAFLHVKAYKPLGQRLRIKQCRGSHVNAMLGCPAQSVVAFDAGLNLVTRGGSCVQLSYQNGHGVHSTDRTEANTQVETFHRQEPNITACVGQKMCSDV